jgi:hypothetical protein
VHLKNLLHCRCSTLTTCCRQCVHLKHFSDRPNVILYNKDKMLNYIIKQSFIKKAYITLKLNYNSMQTPMSKAIDKVYLLIQSLTLMFTYL